MKEIIRCVTKFGNSGHIVLPKELVGHTVYVYTKKYIQPLNNVYTSKNNVYTSPLEEPDEAENHFILAYNSEKNPHKKEDLIEKAGQQFSKERVKHLISKYC